MKEKVLGLVLCGGKSTRMGSDKGLIKEGAFTWSELMKQKFTALGLPSLISINASQQQVYGRYFPAEQFVYDLDLTDINGGLKALLSAHAKHPDCSFFSMPCDMKDVPVKVMKMVLRDMNDDLHYENDMEYLKKPEAYLIETENQKYPICGIYRPEALKKLNKLYQKGDLSNASMIKVTQTKLKVRRIMLNASYDKFLENYNSPEDLQKAEETKGKTRRA